MLFDHHREEDRSDTLEGLQQLLINQSRGDVTEDIDNWDTSSCGNQKRESFIV